MPRLSVIMPVLDGDRYLAQTLASLQSSLPRDAEVLIMDDGSTDSTPRLLDEASSLDARFKILRHEAPEGVAKSLNELAALADCAFLARMDADDLVLRTRWRLTDATLRHADLAFTSALYIDEFNRFRGMGLPGHLSASAIPFHLTFGNCLIHPTVSMRREVFDLLGGYSDSQAEDYELWMRAAVGGFRMVRTALPGLKYRRHGDQITGRQPWLLESDESPLFAAYGELLEQVIGVRPQGWQSVFTFVLGARQLTHEVADDASQLGDLVVRQARVDLSRIDASLVMWRAKHRRRRAREASVSRL